MPAVYMLGCMQLVPSVPVIKESMNIQMKTSPIVDFAMVMWVIQHFLWRMSVLISMK